MFRGYIDQHRLGELLATGDIHVVPLKADSGAFRSVEDVLDHGGGSPRVAAIDADTAVPRMLTESGGGVHTPRSGRAVRVGPA